MIDLSALTRTWPAPAHVAVYGLGKSGVATARALAAAGFRVHVGDDDPVQVQNATRSGYEAFSATDNIWDRARILVLAPGIPLYAPTAHPVVAAAQQANVEIIGDIELLYRNGIAGRTIGVTGTNGKSTTTALTTHILNASGLATHAAGNIGMAVMDLPAAAIANTLVLELSSFQLDLTPTFHPSIAVHLNITPDHIDRHGTIERYIAAKESLFTGPGTAIIGVDDNYSQEMFARIKAGGTRRMIPVSCDNAMNDGIFLSGTDVVDTLFEGGVVGNLSDLPALRGKHNFQNAMMAYAATRAMGLDADTIFDAIETYPGLPHRQFPVRTIRGVDYINDSKATNADAADKALATFKDIYWIAGGLPKAGGLSGLDGYADKIRHAFLIGTAAADFAIWMTARKIPHTISDTLEQAVNCAHDMAQSDIARGKSPGVVLLSPACASYDQFKSFEHRGDVFCTLVRNLPAGKA